MKLTEIQIVPIKPKDGLVGFASFVLNNSFYICSVGIITKPKGGYRLTYPTKNDYNICYPINKSTAHRIETQVISKFEDVTNNDRHSKVNTR